MVILGGVHFPSHFRSHLPAHFFHISHFLASWTSHFWHIFGTIELILDLESYIGHGRHNATERIRQRRIGSVARRGSGSSSEILRNEVEMVRKGETAGTGPKRGRNKWSRNGPKWIEMGENGSDIGPIWVPKGCEKGVANGSEMGVEI